MKKILFYTNQFFGQIGGEEKAGVGPEFREGCVGPANALQPNLKGEIVATIICGDNFYAENISEARAIIDKEVERISPDLFIAGPAFNAGRFGVACGDLCSYIGEKYKIPTLTGLYEENPAVDLYKSGTVIVSVGKSAATMRKAIPAMSLVANKLLLGEALGLPEEDGYIPKGIRVNIFKEKTGAERAVDMLLSKLKGEPYHSEIPIPVYDAIAPAHAVTDMKNAKVAIITTGGIVPMSNPDRLPAATAKFFKEYDLTNINGLEEGAFESVHAGFDPVYANHDPNRIAPVDLLKEKLHDGKIGSLYEKLISTTGNSTSVADATRMGGEIAEILKQAHVDCAIMTST